MTTIIMDPDEAIKSILNDNPDIKVFIDGSRIENHIVRATLQPTEASPEGILVQRQVGSHKNSSVREEGGSYSLRRSHWFSGNPKRTRLESLGINYSLYILQDMCLQCALHVYYMW